MPAMLDSSGARWPAGTGLRAGASRDDEAGLVELDLAFAEEGRLRFCADEEKQIAARATLPDTALAIAPRHELEPGLCTAFEPRQFLPGQQLDVRRGRDAVDQVA
jgi:hypothetical protein